MAVTFSDLPHAKILALIALGLFMALVWHGLSRRNKSSASKIDFDDLLLDPDGRMSKSAVVMFGSFGMMTWLMVYLTLTGKMTEGYAVIYGGLFVTPSVTKLIKGTNAPAP